MLLNVPDGHPFSVHRDDLFIKIADVALSLLNNPRLKGAIPVTRRLYLDFSKIGADGLGGLPVAAVPAVVPLRGMFLVS